MTDLTTCDVLPLDQARNAWRMYDHATRALQQRTPQRTALTVHEFEDLATDTRIAKIVAVDDGRVCGLTAVGNDLDAWPLLSIPHFTHRWPDLAARHGIYYAGVLTVADDAPRDTYRRLLSALHAEAVHGMLVIDTPRHSVTPPIAGTAATWFTALSPTVSHDRIGTHEYWAWRFDGAALDETLTGAGATGE